MNKPHYNKWETKPPEYNYTYIIDDYTTISDMQIEAARLAYLERVNEFFSQNYTSRRSLASD